MPTAGGARCVSRASFQHVVWIRQRSEVRLAVLAKGRDLTYGNMLRLVQEL